MSSLEMASSGLPLIVSRLQGLIEVIDEGKTGYMIEPGNYKSLADKIELLLDDSNLQKRMSLAARGWITANFSRKKQIEKLTATIKELYFNHIGRDCSLKSGW